MLSLHYDIVQLPARMATATASAATPVVNGHESIKTSKLSKGQLRKLKAKQKKEQEQHQPPAPAATAGKTNGAANGEDAVKSEGADGSVPAVKQEDGAAPAVKTEETANMYDEMAEDEDVSHSCGL